MKITSLVWVLLPLCFACGNAAKNTSNQGAATAPDATAQQASDTPATYLEGIYATSTAAGSSVQHLFDSNPATVWQTKPGTGPDEGIMLYFQQPQVVSTLEITAVSGSFTAEKTAQLEIFGNGAIVASGNPGAPIQLGAAPLKSLYIHFLATGKETKQTKNNVTIASYPRDASIGISGILLKNDKGETLRIVAPQVLKGAATASSTLKPEAAYSTANLFDGRKEFCWVEGNAANAGEGESILLSFDDPKVALTAIQFWNGYQRSDEHFGANARVREVEISGGSAQPRTYTLADTKEGQMVRLQETITGGNCTLKIKSVYPGKSYKDLAISEILLFQGDMPCVLQTGFSEKFQAELLSKTASSPLAAWLDHRVTNNLNSDESTTIDQSLILRSDGTFVVYTASYNPDETTPGVEQQTIADGNWELLRADAKTATVKIFGKWMDFGNFDDYYKGPTEQTLIRIFNDVLTVDKNKLTGAKMLGTFYY